MAAINVYELELERYTKAISLSLSLKDKDIALVYPSQFHPKQFLTELKKLADESGVSDEEHKSNLMTLAILGIEQGQNVDRIKQKSSPERRKFLEKMQNIYRLVNGGPLHTTSATLSRIAGCFAMEISLGIYNKTLNINTKVKPAMIAPGFPAFMCLSSFGSLIPRAIYCGSRENFHTIYDAWLFHQVVFDGIINRGKEPTPTFRIKHFAERTHYTFLYSKEEQINHLLTIGLFEVLDEKLIISENYRSALNEAASKWRALQ